MNLRSIIFPLFTITVALLGHSPAYGQEIYRVGTYREYSGYYGSGGGYSGPSADHWMFHERQESRGSSRGASAPRNEPKAPVRPNMVLVPVHGVHLYTDKRSFVEFHEHARRGPSGEYELQNRDMCRITKSPGSEFIRAFSCRGRLANISCWLSNDIVTCNVNQANGEHVGNPGEQRAKLQLMPDGDYNAWIKTRVTAH